MTSRSCAWKGGHRPTKFTELTIHYLQRGWDDADVTDILDNAVEIKASTYKGTGDQTTVYYCSDGYYVVRNDTTGDIFHVSDTADPMWMDSFDEVVRQRP